MERKQFTFYWSFYEAIQNLKSVKAREQCYSAICRYALEGALPEKELVSEARIIFRLIMPILDTASKRAAAGCAKKQNKNKTESNQDQNQNKTEIELENKLEIELKRECEHGRARFDIFWDAYPRKVDKQRAWEQFRKVEEPLQVLLDALQNHKRSAQWLEEGGRYIPRPDQWLKQQRWQDRLSAPEGKVPMGATGELGQAELEAIQRMLSEG